LFELDRWVPQHREELEVLANDRGRGSVDVGGLPIAVSVPAGAVLAGDDGVLAGAIADTAGTRLYTEGRTAFAGEDGGGAISVTEPARWAVSLLGSDAHQFWQIALAASALALGLAVGVVVLTTTASIGGLVRPLLFGSVAFVVACGLFWALALIAAQGVSSPVDGEIGRIVRDACWIGLRAGLASTAVALASGLLSRVIAQPASDRSLRAAYDEAS
jgi:hypothetical protein